jgi:hypothetical protein
VKYVRSFDYLIIKEQTHPDVAVEDLESIVRAERFRIHRLPDNRIKEFALQAFVWVGERSSPPR